MDIKQRIKNIKNKSVALATFVASMFPVQSGGSAVQTAKNIDNLKMLPPDSWVSQKKSIALLTEDVTLGVNELKTILSANPEIALSAEVLSAVQPGPSQQKVKSILSKGFDFTVRNSRGESKKVRCSLRQTPKGYCAGAVKRLLNKVYKEPISNNLSAYQEKDNLLASPNFWAVPIDFKDISACPANTVVVIPQCQKHKHGHIFTVVDKGVYCSDGKELAGEYFDNNYKDAKGIYAFIPVDGSVKLTPQFLQNSPELAAAVISHQTGKDIHFTSRGKKNTPTIYAEAVAIRTSNTR